MAASKHLQVQAAREGGAVHRCHIMRRAWPYDVAQHTYGALSLLLILHPCPSLQLIKAVTFHDVAERWTGDVPATAKWGDSAVSDALHALEDKVLQRLGLKYDLSDEEKLWLKAVDILDLWLWAIENSEEEHPRRVAATCVNYIEERRRVGLFPLQATAFYLRHPREYSTLPDRFDELGEVGPSSQD